MKSIILLVWFFLTSVIFASNWQPTLLKEINIHNQSRYLYIKFDNKRIHSNFYVNAVLLKNNAYSAKIINHNISIAHLFSSRVYTTTKAAHAFLGINGGFFTPEYKPLGLIIINSQTLNAISRSKLLSGLVLINSHGEINLKTKWSHYKKARFALQTGPFLIRPNGHIAVTKPGHKERRTVLALTKKNNLLALSTTSVSLYNLAFALKNNPQMFGAKKISTALNLDGGTSTAMSLFIPHQKPIVIPEFFPVKNILIFYLK